MNRAEKFRKQEEELSEVRTHVVHYAEMTQLAIQALQYIATGGKNMQQEDSKIILLKSAGLPDPNNKVTPPAVVATECLDIIRTMNEKHQQELKQPTATASNSDKLIEEVKLIDGEEIVFSTAFDAMFHKCCGCGLLHEVHLEWDEPSYPISDEGKDGPKQKLRTKWYRRDSDPTIDELESKGKVVSLKEVKQ